MESNEALAKLAALAQETRLAVYRLLMVQGPDGMAAGDIARSLEVPASTLSSHLAILERAGLISASRVQRSIRYAVHIEGSRVLLGFLTEDCCRGNPEICGPAFADAATVRINATNNDIRGREGTR